VNCDAKQTQLSNLIKNQSMQQKKKEIRQNLRWCVNYKEVLAFDLFFF